MPSPIPMFTDSEATLHKNFEQWFDSIGMPYTSQQHTHEKNRVDFMLRFSQSNQLPWCLIEIKNKLSIDSSKVKDLANHFEQCVKYHIGTKLPVFLGPFFIPTMGKMEYLIGGETPKYATGSFSAFAGRLNVGILFINAKAGDENNIAKWNGFRMTMRGFTVAEWHKYDKQYYNTWPDEFIKMVDYNGSASSSVRV